MRITFMVLAAMTLLATPAVAEPVLDNQLLGWCEDDGPSRGICLGYIRGFLDASNDTDGSSSFLHAKWCIPEKVTTEQAASVVVKALKKLSKEHPDELAALITSVAFAAEWPWPCPK